jgi:hypothetical protein
MHTRRLATLLLGAWLAGSFFMTWVATGNFRSVEQVLRSTGTRAQKEINEVGLVRARNLLRYHASEQNRHYFYYWELVQLPLGLILTIVVLFATNGNKLVVALSLSMLALIAIMHFTISPQITELGRVIDFTALDERTAERNAFWGYHRAYSAMELIKIGLGLILAVRMLYSTHQLKRRSTSGASRKKVNAVDHADHTHVDG